MSTGALISEGILFLVLLILVSIQGWCLQLVFHSASKMVSQLVWFLVYQQPFTWVKRPGAAKLMVVTVLAV